MSTINITSSSSCCQRSKINATIDFPRIRTTNFSLPNIPAVNGVAEELSEVRVGSKTATITHIENKEFHYSTADSTLISKMYSIMNLVSDRIEMHKNIGEQRNNWNNMLLTSINTITLTAATMSGIASTIGAADNNGALKISSTLLYVAATGLLVVMNKIQPSQLVEEQRNATRLFKQLHSDIQTMLALRNFTTLDVKSTMEKVLALDRAYPLPLLAGAMLEKFPKTIEPAVWWPQQAQQKSRGKRVNMSQNNNGWNKNLEDEMREVLMVMKNKDQEEYSRLSKTALKLNKALAISGPFLTGIAAIGTAYVGSTSQYGTVAAVVGVLGGALASVVNTVEHGGQVGMVFEMYRSSAGFFKLMEESIEMNLNEGDFERRENGELFEMKVAMKLGRSLSELRSIKASDEEFASKLF